MWLWLACTPLGLKSQCADMECVDTADEEVVEDTDTNSPWPETNPTDTSEMDTVEDTGEEPVDTAEVDTAVDTDTGEVVDTEPVEPCTWDIYDRARDYAADYPLRDGASWSGWCGSLMWRFGEMPESSARPSAIGAYAESTILGMDARTAPIGAFHWWDIGVHGHVAVDLLGGGGTIFMASNYVLEDWGDAIGVTSVSAIA